MGFSALEAQALFLIILVTGHEAIRIHDEIARVGPIISGVEAEENWKNASGHCKWKTWSSHPGCDGRGCVYRPLPLDRGLSSSCRLSIDYMVEQDNLTEHVGNACGFIMRKAHLFKENCAQDTKAWQLKSHARCLRNAGHLLQASEFISAAQMKIGKAAQEIPRTVKESVDEAGTIIASALGENGDLILKLLGEVRENAATFLANDPKNTMKLVVGTIFKLVDGSDAAQEDARGQANELLSRITEARDDITQEEMAKLENEMNESGINEKSLWPRIEEAVITSDGNESALLQINEPIIQKFTGGRVAAIALIILFCVSLMFLPSLSFIPLGIILLSVPLFSIFGYIVYKAVSELRDLFGDEEERGIQPAIEDEDLSELPPLPDTGDNLQSAPASAEDYDDYNTPEIAPEPDHAPPSGKPEGKRSSEPGQHKLVQGYAFRVPEGDAGPTRPERASHPTTEGSHGSSGIQSKGPTRPGRAPTDLSPRRRAGSSDPLPPFPNYLSVRPGRKSKRHRRKNHNKGSLLEDNSASTDDNAALVEISAEFPKETTVPVDDTPALVEQSESMEDQSAPGEQG